MKQIYLLLLTGFFSTTLSAQWNSTGGKAVMTSSRNETLTKAVSDGAGGAIVIGSDYENGGNLYAQKVSSSGAISWGTAVNPVTVVTSPGQKFELEAIPDGSGGAFICWVDYGVNEDIDTSNVYIQRINSAGTRLWPANGVKVNGANIAFCSAIQLCSDNGTGVYVSWYVDDSINANIQAYAQRFNANGAPQWTNGGIQLCTANGFRAPAGMVADGAGNAIIFLLDTRNDPNGTDYDHVSDNDLDNADVYAQKLNSSGSRLWGNNAAAVCTVSGNQQASTGAVADGQGGAIIFFDDDRSDPVNGNYDVYAQRVNGNGAIQWNANGILVSDEETDEYIPKAVSDGAGGGIVLIQGEDDLRAQRINASGTRVWAGNGLVVSSDLSNGNVDIEADGNGNLLVAGAGMNLTTFEGVVQLQKLNSAGVKQWGNAGTSLPAGLGASAPKILPSASNTSIVAWSAISEDQTNLDIFAAKMKSDGTQEGSAAAGPFVSAAAGNWNVGAAWIGGTVPPAGSEVTIRHAVVGNVNTTVKSIRIESPGSFRVSAGVSFNIQP